LQVELVRSSDIVSPDVFIGADISADDISAPMFADADDAAHPRSLLKKATTSTQAALVCPVCDQQCHGQKGGTAKVFQFQYFR
jgi:hypothetical protein